MRQSTSFNDDEVEVLGFILRTLLRGGDPRMVARNKAFPGLVRKIHEMQAKIDQARNTVQAEVIKNEPMVRTSDVYRPIKQRESDGG